MWKKEGLDLIDTIKSPTPTAFCKNIWAFRKMFDPAFMILDPFVFILDKTNKIRYKVQNISVILWKSTGKNCRFQYFPHLICTVGMCFHQKSLLILIDPIPQIIDLLSIQRNLLFLKVDLHLRHAHQSIPVFDLTEIKLALHLLQRSWPVED
jgi:hypothetical protein